jgi:hypothetical protein
MSNLIGRATDRPAQVERPPLRVCGAASTVAVSTRATARARGDDEDDD